MLCHDQNKKVAFLTCFFFFRYTNQNRVENCHVQAMPKCLCDVIARFVAAGIATEEGRPGESYRFVLVQCSGVPGATLLHD